MKVDELPNLQLFWRINGHIEHHPLNKPMNMDKKGPM